MEPLKVILSIITAVGLGYCGYIVFKIVQNIAMEKKYKFDDEEERERFEFEQRKGDSMVDEPVCQEESQEIAKFLAYAPRQFCRRS